MEVVIIGLGSIGVKHLAALKEIDASIKVYALRSQKYASALDGIQNIYSFEEIINVPDFFIISNPTVLHSNTIKKIALYGVPMFIEKPAVHSKEECDELVNTICKTDLISYVACNLRFHPCIKFIKNYISSKKPRINEINIYCGSNLAEWRPGIDYKQSYSAHPEMGGGVHLDLFHEMDYAIWIFGHPSKHRGFTSRISSIQIDAPDFASYLLSYPSYNISLTLNYYRNKAKRLVELLFDNESWTIDLLTSKIFSDNGKLIFESEKFTLKDTYLDQMNYFINCVQSGVKPMNSLEESLKILKISLEHEPLKG
jgi:predicted dehydrogenase